MAPCFLTRGDLIKSPCKALTPIVEKVSSENPGMDFFSMVIDQDGVNTATIFGVRSIPQLYILKNGKVVSQKVGASDYKTVSDWVKENI